MSAQEGVGGTDRDMARTGTWLWWKVQWHVCDGGVLRSLL